MFFVEKNSPLILGVSEHSNESGDGPTVNEIIIIDPDCLELDLNHGRINKLQYLEPLTCVEKLYFRWNFITKIENLDHLVTLKELELYDNQITKIENLGCLMNLEILDLSFNRIKDIEGLENLTNLSKLFLSSNKITKIENLNHLVNLNLLELGDNKVRVSYHFYSYIGFDQLLRNYIFSYCINRLIYEII